MSVFLEPPCCDDHKRSGAISISQDAIYGAITNLQAAIRKKMKDIWTPSFDHLKPSAEYVTLTQLIREEDEILRELRTSNCHQCLLEEFVGEQFYAEPLYIGAILKEDIMYKKFARVILALMEKGTSTDDVTSFIHNLREHKENAANLILCGACKQYMRYAVYSAFWRTSKKEPNGCNFSSSRISLQ